MILRKLGQLIQQLLLYLEPFDDELDWAVIPYIHSVFARPDAVLLAHAAMAS